MLSVILGLLTLFVGDFLWNLGFLPNPQMTRRSLCLFSEYFVKRESSRPHGKITKRSKSSSHDSVTPPTSNHEFFPIEGLEKPRLEELGPYAYRQILTKEDIEFRQEGESVFYTAKRIFQFAPGTGFTK
jgi:hypothetical protein